MESTTSSTGNRPHRVQMAHAPETSVHASQLGPVRLPIHFFAVATAFFLLGVSAMPWITPDVIEFFYQPLPLALVHAFTLGWITATIMGVMYRYVPALTRTPLRFPRLAYAQLILFVIGAAGMVAHFAIGVWLGTWLAAIVMVVSVIMFAANMLPCLAPKAGGGVAETGMLIAVGFLVLAASVGLLLALDKTFGFLHGSVLTNLAGHAHLAALGWVTLTICAVSYRMIPAFVLPQVGLPRSAVWQLYGLAFGVAGLVATLFAEIPVVIKFEIHPSGPAPLKGHAGQSHHFWVHS